MEVSSYAGNVVFDGFAGAGTVPAVAQQLKRKCIAMEQNQTYFEAMQHRIAQLCESAT